MSLYGGIKLKGTTTPASSAAPSTPSTSAAPSTSTPASTSTPSSAAVPTATPASSGWSAALRFAPTVRKKPTNPLASTSTPSAFQDDDDDDDHSSSHRSSTTARGTSGHTPHVVVAKGNAKASLKVEPIKKPPPSKWGAGSSMQAHEQALLEAKAKAAAAAHQQAQQTQATTTTKAGGSGPGATDRSDRPKRVRRIIPIPPSMTLEDDSILPRPTPPSTTSGGDDVNGFAQTAIGQKLAKEQEKKQQKGQRGKKRKGAGGGGGGGGEDPALRYGEIPYDPSRPCDYAGYKTHIKLLRAQRRLDREEEERQRRRIAAGGSDDESDAASYYSEDEREREREEEEQRENASKRARFFAPPSSYDPVDAAVGSPAQSSQPPPPPAPATTVMSREETADEAYARRVALSNRPPAPPPRSAVPPSYAPHASHPLANAVHPPAFVPAPSNSTISNPPTVFPPPQAFSQHRLNQLEPREQGGASQSTAPGSTQHMAPPPPPLSHGIMPPPPPGFVPPPSSSSSTLDPTTAPFHPPPPPPPGFPSTHAAPPPPPPPPSFASASTSTLVPSAGLHPNENPTTGAVDAAAARAREIAARLSKLGGAFAPPPSSSSALPTNSSAGSAQSGTTGTGVGVGLGGGGGGGGVGVGAGQGTGFPTFRPAGSNAGLGAGQAPPEASEPDTRPFAERIMSKYGWCSGKGLGRDESGMTTALSVVRPSAGSSGQPKLSRHQRKKLKAANGGVVPPGPAAGGMAGKNTVIDRSKASRAEHEQAAMGGEPSRVVVLDDLCDVDQVDDDLPGEIADEANKVGVVERCAVVVVKVEKDDEAEGDGQDEEDEVVRVFLVMSGLAGGYNAVKSFEGRFFGGRTVRARFYDEEAFKQGLHHL